MQGASPRKKCKAKSFTLEDRQLAETMCRAVLAMQPERKPPNLDAWANDIRLMREFDNRTHDGIRELFARVQHNDFWRKNILSPGKLREKWDDLQLQLKVDRPPFKTRVRSEGRYANDDWS